ncbi:MAG: DUF4175 family protein, partial [Gammaproteobacteria bacterium]|nr:DUF4175 family protein [Gammaproteobacteria bacterium]
MLLLQRDHETVALDWNLGACIECRWCDRVCPADIPLTDIFKWMKHEDQTRVTQNAEAQQALQELQQMLQNMQIAEGSSGEGAPREQALQGLEETLRGQQNLSDEAFRNLQQAPSQSPGEGLGQQ